MRLNFTRTPATPHCNENHPKTDVSPLQMMRIWGLRFEAHLVHLKLLADSLRMRSTKTGSVIFFWLSQSTQKTHTTFTGLKLEVSPIGKHQDQHHDDLGNHCAD